MCIIHSKYYWVLWLNGNRINGRFSINSRFIDIYIIEWQPGVSFSLSMSVSDTMEALLPWEFNNINKLFKLCSCFRFDSFFTLIIIEWLIIDWGNRFIYLWSQNYVTRLFSVIEIVWHKNFNSSDFILKTYPTSFCFFVYFFNIG